MSYPTELRFNGVLRSSQNAPVLYRKSFTRRVTVPPDNTLSTSYGSPYTKPIEPRLRAFTQRWEGMPSEPEINAKSTMCTALRPLLEWLHIEMPVWEGSANAFEGVLCELRAYRLGRGTRGLACFCRARGR